MSHIDYSLPDTYECTCDELPIDCRCDDEREDPERDGDDEYDRMREDRADDGRY